MWKNHKKKRFTMCKERKLTNKENKIRTASFSDLNLDSNDVKEMRSCIKTIVDQSKCVEDCARTIIESVKNIESEDRTIEVFTEPLMTDICDILHEYDFRGIGGLHNELMEACRLIDGFEKFLFDYRLSRKAGSGSVAMRNRYGLKAKKFQSQWCEEETSYKATLLFTTEFTFSEFSTPSKLICDGLSYLETVMNSTNCSELFAFKCKCSFAYSGVFEKLFLETIPNLIKSLIGEDDASQKLAHRFYASSEGMMECSGKMGAKKAFMNSFVIVMHLPDSISSDEVREAIMDAVKAASYTEYDSCYEDVLESTQKTDANYVCSFNELYCMDLLNLTQIVFEDLLSSDDLELCWGATGLIQDEASQEIDIYKI